MNGAADQPMGAEEFVRGVHDAVYVAACRGVENLIAQPPGQNPGGDLIEVSDWWNALGTSDRELVRRVAAMTADHAVFGFFCVLDNVRTIVDRPDVELQLHAVVNGVGHRVPGDEALEMHDIFSDLVAQGPSS